jgi:hypothetical protein
VGRNTDGREKETKTMPELAPGPLFIVSMWRAGSSLLYALLNKHPQVALMYEADLLLLHPVFLKPPLLRDWTSRWEFWNEAFSRHGLDPAQFADHVAEFTSAFEAVHQEYARRKGARIWGDKSPNYYDRLDRISKDFPHTRFIIVWRHPIDTIGATIRAADTGNSYFRKPGMLLRSLLGSRVLKRQCDAIVAAGASVHQVQYEDLVSDTAVVMRGLCQFLQIPYDPSLSTLEGADRSAVYEGKHHSLLRKDAIVAGPRPDVLDPRLRTRIDHYITLWSETDSAERRTISPGPTPSPAQMCLDQLRYRLYRTLDACTRVAFCFLPIPLLRLYRKAKAYAREAKMKRDSTPTIAARELPLHELQGMNNRERTLGNK